MTDSSRRPDRRFPITGLLAFGWLLVVRLILGLQSGVWPHPGWMLAADLAGALVLAVLLLVIRGRRGRIVLVAVLGITAFAAGAHLAAHGTLFRLAHFGKAADPVFIVSSVVNPQLLLLALYLALAWLLHRLQRRLAASPPARPGWLLGTGALVVALYLAVAPSLTTPANNMVAGTLAQAPKLLVDVFGPGDAPDDKLAKADPDDWPAFFRGQTAAPEIGEPPNVLLIIIEGLSGGYLPKIADYHDLQPAVTLPGLERWLDDNGFRTWRNALSMDRQTDRGTYAILCGDYPGFGNNGIKMLAVAEGRADPECLPEHLAAHAYRTAYWQAAPLTFMGKDVFMPKIGFEHVTGAEYFYSDVRSEGWGPPDSLYFPVIAERLRRLDPQADPWFVTLLNVGTHHPFDSGDSSPALTPPEPQDDRRRAMQAMAESLTRFLDALAADGILDDTLVIITSDESGGFMRRESDPAPLDGNFGFLALRPPAGGLERFAGRDRLVAQIDVAPTILDAAGIGDRTGAMPGRSLMITGDEGERGLLLGDTYTGRKMVLLESGRLMACTEHLARCSAWRFDPGRVFGSLGETDAEAWLERRQRAALFDLAGRIRPRDPATRR